MNLSYWPFMIYLPIWFHAGLGLDSFATGLALLAYTLPTLTAVAGIFAASRLPAAMPARSAAASVPAG